jgi:hypothetical protein
VSRPILKPGEVRTEIILAAPDARKFSKLCGWLHLRKAPAMRKAILDAYERERQGRNQRRILKSVEPFIQNVTVPEEQK